MAKTKKQGENSACSALFEHAYYSSGYGINRPPWVGNMAPLSPDTDRTGSRDFAR